MSQPTPKRNAEELERLETLRALEDGIDQPRKVAMSDQFIEGLNADVVLYGMTTQDAIDRLKRENQVKPTEMLYKGTLESYSEIVAWMKAEGDTSALANEVIFHTRIIVFPGVGHFESAYPGDFVVRVQGGFTVSRKETRELAHLRALIEEAREVLKPLVQHDRHSGTDDDDVPCNAIVCRVGAILAKATEPTYEPLTLADLHQAHYRVCNCLGDSAECCQKGCRCHAKADES